ncbi:MAG TPA: Maf family protein [Candidatus Acidoferrales bacterium]|nr:Maf family protein [Candidatus Acidoferrales bacterium]
MILASKSPRRAEILRNAGIVFEVQMAHVNEARRPRESAHSYVRRLAAAKVRAVAEHAKRKKQHAIVIGADTVVLAQGKVLGKPADVKEARRMLRLLSGRTHRVLTGVAMVSLPSGKEVHHVEATRVKFLKISGADIDDYIATGEPFDKAGAYGIQGIGGRFVASIDGCYFNVMGLPLARVWGMLRDLGYANASAGRVWSALRNLGSHAL